MFNPFIGVTKIISAEVSGKFAELQTKVDNIQSKGYDDTQLRNSIQQLSSVISSGIVVDAYTKLETDELLSAKVNVSDFNDYKEQISSELSSIIDNTIYDDTEIKADITELSSKLDNLEISGGIYDDTQLRGLIAAETDTRILENANLSSQIEILKLEKGDDYTAFEVFPHNFIIQDTGAISNNTAKTVAEMFQPWQKVKSSGGIKFINVTNTDVGQLNNYYYTVQNNIKSYKRFHPVSGFIDITLENVTELPQIGDINTLYKISDAEYYLYYDEAIRNLRKCLTTAKDDHVFFKLKLGYQLSIKLRTHLSQEQVDNGKSNIIIDWGDGEQTVFKNYTLKDPNNYIFNHIYAKQNWNKNLIVKIYGDAYYLLQFNENNYTTSTSMIIVSRIFDYDLPVAKCLTRFPNFCANNLVYSVDIRKCNKLFEGCNIGSMFTTPCLQQAKGFTDAANESAFNSIYCMNFMFNGVGTLKTIDFKFPALCKLPIFQYIFNGVYFNYGGEPYDILNLFNNFSFNLMPKDEAIDVAGMFYNCKNITCSNIEKLGKILWNNPNLTWTNTSSVFGKVTADFLSGVPVEWGGTLTGWVPPTENTFDDTEIRELISDETENRILEDNKLNTAITQLSGVISGGVVANAYTRAETDELLSAKLDTNIFDEYAEQISEELNTLTITDADISEQVNVLDKKINLLKVEKSNDYTAFEIFPHDFRIFPYGAYSVETPQGIISNSARIKDVFTDWIPAVVLNSGVSTGKNLLDIYYDSTNKIYTRYVYDASAQNYITEYVVSSPLEPDFVVEKMQNLPEIGEYDKLYKVEQTGKVYMYAAYLKQYRKFLPTATDDDIFYDIQGATTLTMAFRTNLSKEQVDANKSDVVIDWGDNTITKFNEYNSADGGSRTYTFSHDYKETYKLNNGTDFRADRKYLVKITGKDYFGLRTASQQIIINMSTVDCPIASCVKAFNGFFAGRMMFNVDLGYYGPTFYNCNLSEMFYAGTIREITGFKRAFTDRLYAISFAFQGIRRMNGSKFDFTIPAEVTNANFSKLFYGITFYIGNTTQKYDILKLFNPRSFADMKNYSSVNVDSMFGTCSNITCSDYQKLGKFLWNNTDINWTNTSTVFVGCPDELRANIPEQWGGTLTGWTAPEQLTKEYVDNKDNLLINDITELNSKLENLVDNDTIYDDTSIVQQISTISSEIQQLNTIIKTNGTGTKFLADDGTYYQIVTSNNGANSSENTGNTNIGTSSQLLDIDALSTYLDENGYLRVVPAEFITETQLKQKNYIDEQYLTTNNYVNQQYLTQQEYMRSLDIYEHPVVLELIEHINNLYTRITQLSEEIRITKTNVDNNVISVVWDSQENNTDSTSGQIL